MSSNLDAANKGRSEYGPAVHHGMLYYLSVSQVNTFDSTQYGGCNRRWFFEKVERRKSADTFAQQQGTTLHAQVETYEKTGDASVLGPFVIPGLRFIPEPGPGLLIEHAFGDAEFVKRMSKLRTDLETATDEQVRAAVRTTIDLEAHGRLVALDVPFVGFIDIVNTRGTYLTNEGELLADPPNTVELLDWKSTSSISQYAKSGDDLRETVQMIGYAEWSRRVYPSTEFFRLSHGYFQTRGAKKALKTTTLIDVSTVNEKWFRVESVVRKMKEVAKERDALKVDPNYESCDAYKGCPHRSTCDKARGAASMLVGRGGIIRIKKKDGASMTQNNDGGFSLLDELLKQNGEGHPTTNKDTTPGVLPPDAPRSRAPSNALPLSDAELAALSPEVRAGVERWSCGDDATVSGEVASVAKLCLQRSVEMRASGLTPPEVDITKLLDDKGPSIDPALIRERGEKLAARGADPSLVNIGTGMAGVVLFVDTLVEGLVVDPLDSYVFQSCVAVMRACGLEGDIRIAPAQSALGYGKWKGELTAYVQSAPPPAGVYSLTFLRDNEVKQVVAEALRAVCTTYVRGIAY